MTKSKLKKPEIEQSIINRKLVTFIELSYSDKLALAAHKLFSELLLRKEYGTVQYLNFNETSFSLEFVRKATKNEIKEDEALAKQEIDEYLQKRIADLKKSAMELGFSLTPLK